jgi:hypothetical protein
MALLSEHEKQTLGRPKRIDFDALAEDVWTLCHQYKSREDVLEDLVRTLRDALR